MRTSPRLSGVAVVAAGLLAAACRLDEGMCCVAPQTEVDVAFGWTVNGLPAATACDAVGAASVRLEVRGPGPEPAVLDVPCSEGAATVHATVFLPALGLNSAGVAFLRLRSQDGAELSARHVYLGWVDGSVGAEVPLVTSPPGGSVRYRWCEPLPDSGALTVQADGPMWVEQKATAAASETVFASLAPGRYTFSALPEAAPGFGPADVEVDVVADQETLVTVSPCPPG